MIYPAQPDKAPKTAPATTRTKTTRTLADNMPAFRQTQSAPINDRKAINAPNHTGTHGSDALGRSSMGAKTATPAST